MSTYGEHASDIFETDSVSCVGFLWRWLIFRLFRAGYHYRRLGDKKKNTWVRMELIVFGPDASSLPDPIYPLWGDSVLECAKKAKTEDGSDRSREWSRGKGESFLSGYRRAWSRKAEATPSVPNGDAAVVSGYARDVPNDRLCHYQFPNGRPFPVPNRT